MLATRARGPALVVVALSSIQGHRTGERLLSSGARPCCDVPAAASKHSRLSRGSSCSPPLFFSFVFNEGLPCVFAF